MALGLFGKKPEKIKAIRPEERPQAAEKETRTDKEQEIKIELLKEEINALKEMNSATNERISHLNETIGEIKEMSLNTERDSKTLSLKAEQALTIIKETEPEKISAKLEKFDQKIEKQQELLNQFKEMLNATQAKQKEISEKMSIIKGAESLLNLNTEVREELMNIKKIQAKTERDADRVESIYINYQKEFSELSDIKNKEDSIEKLQKDMVREIDDNKIKMQALAEKKSIEALKADFNAVTGKLNKLDKISSDMQKSKEKIEYLIKNFETEFSDFSKFKEQIADYSELKTDCSELKTDYSELKEQIADYAGLKEQIELLEQEINELKSEIKQPVYAPAQEFHVPSVEKFPRKLQKHVKKAKMQPAYEFTQPAPEPTFSPQRVISIPPQRVISIPSQLKPKLISITKSQPIPKNIRIPRREAEPVSFAWRLSQPHEGSIFEEIKSEKIGTPLKQREAVSDNTTQRMAIENSLSLIADADAKTVYPFLLQIERALYGLKQKNALPQNWVPSVLAGLQKLREVHGLDSLISWEIAQSMGRIKNI